MFRLARNRLWPRPRRVGVTLIELLIVVIIMVMVISVAIPLLKFNFGDKKIRETARQLNAYFALAKSLAAERNRQVGVMFERTPGNLNQCISIYLVEVPPPYIGDVLDARAYVRRNPNLNLATYGTQWQVVFDTVDVLTGAPSQKCAMLTHTRSLVNVNDTFLMRFNYRGAVYQVKRFQVNAQPQNDLFVMQANPTPVPIAGCWMPFDRNTMTGAYDFVTPNQGWGVTNVDDDGVNGTDDVGEQGMPVSSMSSNTPPLDASDFPVGLSFQIYLSPKRTQAQPLDLPVGVAIDLAWSGMGAGGTECDAWTGPGPLTPDTAPVMVLFTPGGQVERVYADYGAFTAPTGTLHFLIASPETIQPLAAGGANAAINPRVNDLNLQDQTHLWISVGPMNASVTTAENFYDASAYTLDNCRKFARSAQSKGGG